MHLAAIATSVLQYSKYPKLHHSLERNCENHEIQGCLLMPLMDVIFTEHILTDLSMDL
jgi:cobalamin biosynthesis Co2+ chelatase CbiK